MISRFAVATSLVLVLSACGSPAEEADQPTGMSAEPAAVETAASDEALPEAEATDAADATETPLAEPTATASPTPTPTPTAAATQAAAAAAPASPPAGFAQCAVCHKTGPGENGLGPTLAGVYGAKAGHISGFKYSQALLDSGLTWNEANLDRFLADPRGVVPGTTMAFAGVKDAGRRAEIVEYLKGL